MAKLPPASRPPPSERKAWAGRCSQNLPQMRSIGEREGDRASGGRSRRPHPQHNMEVNHHAQHPRARVHPGAGAALHPKVRGQESGGEIRRQRHDRRAPQAGGDARRGAIKRHRHQGGAGARRRPGNLGRAHKDRQEIAVRGRASGHRRGDHGRGADGALRQAQQVAGVPDPLGGRQGHGLIGHGRRHDQGDTAQTRAGVRGRDHAHRR